jgi:hypothetical protein
MRILASAQPFGFGPVAKLVGMARQLEAGEISFLGSGIALRYAQLNGSHLDSVGPFDFEDIPRAREVVKRFDAVMSIMEPQLVYVGVRERRPVYFFDSLFGFWLVDRPLDDLARIARIVASGSEREAEAAFRSLSVHESMVVSHLISTRSYAQSFPGVSERVETMSSLGFDTITVTGPMIDLDEIQRLREATPASPRTLVVNLGGFTNTFLDYAKHGSYVDIILRWLTSRVETTSAFDRIIVGSGAFTTASEEEHRGVRIRVGLVPHTELLSVLAGRPVYLTAPGLISLCEAVALGIAPMLLPDQHFGHAYTRRRLRHTSLGRHGASFADLALQAHLPDDDLEGTMMIAGIADKVGADKRLFDAFVRYMDVRFDSFLAMTHDEIRTSVAELATLLDGVPIGKVMNDVMKDLQDKNGKATRSS